MFHLGGGGFVGSGRVFVVVCVYRVRVGVEQVLAYICVCAVGIA